MKLKLKHIYWRNKMISKDKVLHIADLAKLNIEEKEMAKYQIQLTDILTEIDKILKVDINEEEIMISPTNNKNCLSEDIPEMHLSKDNMLKNAKRVKGDYIIVPKVIE